MKKSDHRLAVSEATAFILNSTVGSTPPAGADGDEWNNHVKTLWTSVVTLAKKVKKYWQALPLQVVLLIMQQDKIFTQFCEPIMNNLLDLIKDPAMRQLALESIYRVVFAYFHKFSANTQSSQHTKFLFSALTNNLYPVKGKTIPPSRSCVDTYVDIIDLLAMKHYETVMKNFITEYIVLRDQQVPEPLLIGLISFMSVSNRHRQLKSPDTETLLVGHVTTNKSLGYYEFRKESLRLLGEKYNRFTHLVSNIDNQSLERQPNIPLSTKIQILQLSTQLFFRRTTLLTQILVIKLALRPFHTSPANHSKIRRVYKDKTTTEGSNGRTLER